MKKPINQMVKVQFYKWDTSSFIYFYRAAYVGYLNPSLVAAVSIKYGGARERKREQEFVALHNLINDGSYLYILKEKAIELGLCPEGEE